MAKPPACGWKHEKAARKQGALRIAGLDEVGRGPLFGPVVAAAVILAPRCRLEGLTDSKKLSEKKRNEFEILIRANAVAWAVAAVDVETIDRINIRRASLLAMRLAVEQLALSPDYLLIDGIDCIDWPCPSSQSSRAIPSRSPSPPRVCWRRSTATGCSSSLTASSPAMAWPAQGLWRTGALGCTCPAGTDAAAPQELQPGFPIGVTIS